MFIITLCCANTFPYEWKGRQSMILICNWKLLCLVKVEVKWSRYRPCVAQRVGRGIALLFRDRGTRRGWVVSSTPRPHFTPRINPVPIVQEAGWLWLVKAVPLQAWTGPEGSTKLRLPDFATTAQDGGKVVSLTHRPPLPQEIPLVLISVRGWVDPRAIVRSEGFYVNEKFQWHQLGSNQRPSDL